MTAAERQRTRPWLPWFQKNAAVRQTPSVGSAAPPPGAGICLSIRCFFATLGKDVPRIGDRASRAVHDRSDERSPRTGVPKRRGRHSRIGFRHKTAYAKHLRTYGTASLGGRWRVAPEGVTMADLHPQPALPTAPSEGAGDICRPTSGSRSATFHLNNDVKVLFWGFCAVFSPKNGECSAYKMFSTRIRCG